MALYQAREKRTSTLRASQSLGFLVGTALAVAVAFGLMQNVLSRPNDRPGVLVVRINPNTAPVASLARLPGIGWTRARAIVTYRERIARERPDMVAFNSLGDLQRIRGIGPKTAEGLMPWLRFN